jgi:hypothetical protein
MKTILSWILLLPVTLLSGQSDEAAAPYLDKIARDLDPGHALSIEFGYIREDQQAESSIEGEGTLVLMGEKYKINLDEAIVWFDGEKQYSLQTEIEEVYISKPDPENKEFMFSDPIRLLRNYNEEFKYRFIGENSFQGKTVEEIQLYPKELGGPYALIKLYFSLDKSTLQAIVIRHKQGIIYTMIVTSLERMDNPGAPFFKFSQTDFPNVDVIELID